MKVKKTVKTSVEMIKEIRNFWGFNPQTRVIGNKKRNKKKLKEQIKRDIEKELKNF